MTDPSSRLAIASRWNRDTVGVATIASVILLVCGLAATAWIYRDPLEWLVRMWRSSDDYSHGFLVPLVAAYVLWVRRDVFSPAWIGGDRPRLLLIGATILFAALGLRLLGIYTSIRTFEGISLIPFLIGIVSISVGWNAAKWSMPGLLFLVFMVPLPPVLGNKLSGELQSVATQTSLFSIQTLGVPAVADGNIILLTEGSIGVAEACSGLRMLYAFLALSVAACLIIDSSRIEKLVIVAFAIPIAIAVNCLRITSTAVAYEYGEPSIAEHIFHDVAGWLMIPVGLAMLLAALEVLRHLFVAAEIETIH